MKIIRPSSVIAFAFAFSLAVPILGYVLLGWIPALLFTPGFIGGFLLWILFPISAPFSQLKFPYFITLILYIFHKWEERHFDFFGELSKLTGVAVPSTNSLPVYLLYLFAAAWLLIPILVSRRYAFGYYLSWTFFTSMGVVELAHFGFPIFTGATYGYFPGMGSVILLAPAAWWGVWRMTRNSITCQVS